MLGAVLALLVLAGCAAAPLKPASTARASERAARPESSATPTRPRAAEPSPPESSAEPTPAAPAPRVMIVKASAYNSRRGQTDASPGIGAWGDRLVPGMKVIAVSKDLIELGLRRGQRVRIAGLPGEFVVLDRMPSRWRQKIDIYMGHDVRAALRWGVRNVEISWVPQDETSIGTRSRAGDDSSGRPIPDILSEAD
ncbi:MAG: hypothetical protein U0900_09375 [Myxococcota bacterium]